MSTIIILLYYMFCFRLGVSDINIYKNWCNDTTNFSFISLVINNIKYKPNYFHCQILFNTLLICFSQLSSHLWCHKNMPSIQSSQHYDYQIACNHLNTTSNNNDNTHVNALQDVIPRKTTTNRCVTLIVIWNAFVSKR